jgi:putative phosphotransacetylase
MGNRMSFLFAVLLRIMQQVKGWFHLKQVPLGVSARHIHLSPEHIDHLFGSGYQLKVLKDLSQPGQFAAEETVTIIGPNGQIDKVRVIGPSRKQTQIEISRTDAITLGINAPICESGKIEGTPGIKVTGPKGVIELEKGVIVAARHIHFHTLDAKEWGIKDKQMLRVRLSGERPLIFENVLARVSERYALDMHIDTDEGNAAGVITGDWAEIID